ncbi:tRNA epoxyqueuosine(34) reductase QueG [Cucumibacter marinus]|uniref:tRNA epoxyqueuosine(34) reductase QueG n=1 Tax=Cucumibacter marinus TaxID=1121252 RepID=UPI00042491B6|nr:tRNA epoxyqueuosine(34) reductase QueG [Cucumibacter marinus]
MAETGAALLEEIRGRAEALGFTAVGVTGPDARPDLRERLDHALEAGWQDGMDWMADTADRRADPKTLWADTRSIVMLGMNYGPDRDPLEMLDMPGVGVISAYARHRDYHDIIKGRLKEIAGLIARRAGAEVKVFVDTAPVMEKPLAEAAGIGWQGKNTVLISRDAGTWLFLGAIFTSAELPRSEPHDEQCGTCTRCLDICPTDAFPAPFRLDARRCIAYLTNEHQGPIPVEFRKPMGNRIYGCDDCLAVCPWNKFASATQEAKLAARSDLNAPSLSELAGLDDQGFRRLFAGSPVKRIGRARFLRNVLIAIGNDRENAEAENLLTPHLNDDSPLIRGAAVWALMQQVQTDRFVSLKEAHMPQETDPDVCAEWLGEAP